MNAKVVFYLGIFGRCLEYVIKSLNYSYRNTLVGITFFVSYYVPRTNYINIFIIKSNFLREIRRGSNKKNYEVLDKYAPFYPTYLFKQFGHFRNKVCS